MGRGGLDGRGRAHGTSLRLLKSSVKVVRHTNADFGCGKASDGLGGNSRFLRYAVEADGVRGSHPFVRYAKGWGTRLEEIRRA